MAAPLCKTEGASRPKQNAHSTTALLDLPSDITEKICDAIDHSSDACGLSHTCTSLRYPAQRRVFKKIIIQNNKHVNSLNTRFNSNPLLPNMIRHLKLNMTRVDTTRTGEKLCELLDKLSCLQSFTLEGISAPATWGSFPREIQLAIRGLFGHCKNLEKIKLRYLRQLPPDLFDDCVSLRELAVCHNIDYPPVKEFDLLQARTVHRLDTFKIICERNRVDDEEGLPRGPSILAYCTSRNGFDLTNLQSLHIVLNSCFDDLSGILNVCASSLKHLKIATYGYTQTPPNFTINLSMLTSLQTLCLYLHELPISQYPQYVSTLAPPPSLHSISISTELRDGNRTTRAIHHLHGLVSSLHALHVRSLDVRGSLRTIQLYVPSKKGPIIQERGMLEQEAKRYLAWPNQETKGVFEVHWRQYKRRFISRLITNEDPSD